MDIKKVIKEKGFTLQKIGEKWTNKEGEPKPTDKSAISNMINKNPTVATLERIANIIDCKVSDFFKDEITPDNFTALIDNEGTLYKATSLEELKSIIKQIETKNE